MLLLLLAGLTGCQGREPVIDSLELASCKTCCVGELVKVTLPPDAPPGASLGLVDAEKTSFSAAQLRESGAGTTTRQIVIPPDIAPGQATLTVASGTKAGLQAELFIERLALARYGNGIVEQIPLPPARSARRQLATGVDLLALAPRGGVLFTYSAASGRARRLRLTADGSTTVLASAVLQSLVSMAALNDTDLVACDPSRLMVLRLSDRLSISSKPLSGCRAVAAATGAARAAVLHECETNGDGVQEDCVTLMREGQQLVLDPTVSIDQQASALALHVRVDGKAAVIADTDALNGVWFGGKQTADVHPFLTQASRVQIGRGLTSLGDTFSVSGYGPGDVVSCAFDGQVLKTVSTFTPPGTVRALAYGRRAQLYLAGTDRLWRADTQLMQPTVTKVGIDLKHSVARLAVQP